MRLLAHAALAMLALLVVSMIIALTGLSIWFACAVWGDVFHGRF